jgi:hypothetical protein
MIIDVIESFDGENLYFVGEGEIEKPVFVSHPIGTFVAISSSGAAGKKHIFTAGEVSHIPNMETIETPDWLKSMLHYKNEVCLC